MPINILMPALSPTMTEGKLSKWVKKEGDRIKSGDVIAEIETDKATMEVEAADDGVLGKILVTDGSENVAVNTPIAVLLEEGEDSSALTAAAPKQIAPVAVPDATPQKQEKQQSVVQPQTAPAAGASDGARVFASPLARRLAAEKGIDLHAVKGSGPHGRIVRDDLNNVKQGVNSVAVNAVSGNGAATVMRTSGPDAKQLADLLGMRYTEIPNNNIRKVVASRLLESKQTVPHFYLTIDCMIDDLLVAREKLNADAKGAYKLSVNDFVVKASAMALMAHPAANVAWTDNAILQYDSADI